MMGIMTYNLTKRENPTTAVIRKGKNILPSQTLQP